MRHVHDNRSKVLPIMLMLPTIFIAGCYSDGGYYEPYDDYYVERSYYYDHYPRYHYDHRRYRDYHRGDRHDDRVRVPRDAEVVANGRGGLEYRAEQPGRVYVRDEKTGKVIYRGRVEPGQEVKVAADAKGRRVSVDGKTARGDLSAKPREREIFFRPDRRAAARAQRQERAAIQAAKRQSARAERAAARETRRSPGRSGDGDKKD